MATREEKGHTLVFFVCVTAPAIVLMAHVIAYWYGHLVVSAFLFCLTLPVGIVCIGTARRLGAEYSGLSTMIVAALLLAGSLLWMSPIGRDWLELDSIVRIPMALVVAGCSGLALVLLVLQRGRA